MRAELNCDLTMLLVVVDFGVYLSKHGIEMRVRTCHVLFVIGLVTSEQSRAIQIFLAMPRPSSARTLTRTVFYIRAHTSYS